MKVTATTFKDLVILEPDVIGDNRGSFMESYNRRTFESLGLNTEFVQDNQSRSRQGVLRGLHYQLAPYAQSKLIRVLHGSILDVVVDLRRDQPTFSQHFTIELSSEKRNQVFIPKGFAHGFVVLSEYAEVLYKCDEYYHRESERGIAFDDRTLAIDWRLSVEQLVLSEKDRLNPTIKEAEF